MPLPRQIAATRSKSVSKPTHWSRPIRNTSPRGVRFLAAPYKGLDQCRRFLELASLRQFGGLYHADRDARVFRMLRGWQGQEPRSANAALTASLAFRAPRTASEELPYGM